MDDEPADAADASSDHAPIKTDATARPDVIPIASGGDVVLDVLFETSKETLQSARLAERAATKTSATTNANANANRPPLQQRLRRAFRADAAVLKKHSRYFANLLGDTRFQEARAVEEALAALNLSGVRPADADASRLPWVRIVDDDEGSRSAGRELVFAELLRMLHGGDALRSGEDTTSVPSTPTPVKSRSSVVRGSTRGARGGGAARGAARGGAKTARGAKTVAAPAKAATLPAKTSPPPPPSLPGSRWSVKTPPSLPELATLALQADRFDCAAPIAAYVRALRPRFPQPVARATRDEDGHSSLPALANEEAIRQKIFVAWIFDMPLHFDRSTRDLILYGSQRWQSEYEEDGEYEEEAEEEDPALAAWWDLPDGLEGKTKSLVD